MRIRYFVTAVFTMPICVGLWALAVHNRWLDATLLPSPSAVCVAWWHSVKTGEMVSDVDISLKRVFTGFCLGAGLAVPFGVLTGRTQIFALTLGQLINLLRSIPAIAVVPLAIIWFGIGEPAKYFLVAWGVFFPVWINTHLGARRVEHQYIWAAESLGERQIGIMWKVVLPCALPTIIAGLRSGVSVSFICLVAAEMSGAFGGVGYRIYESYLVFRVDMMIADMIVLGCMGAICDMFFVLIIRWIVPWYHYNQKS